MVIKSLCHNVGYAAHDETETSVYSFCIWGTQIVDIILRFCFPLDMFMISLRIFDFVVRN